MRTLSTAVFVGAALFAAPALAWNETQPAANGPAVWAYNAGANYCPAGLQPVVVGGVVCCGTPTHHGYQSHPTPVRKHKPARHVSYSQPSAPVVVYEKGQ